MKIVRATEMGMCFGVRDALNVMHAIDEPERATIYGELVHNPEVNRRLAQVGFHQCDEDRRGTDVATPIVVITAHGISQHERERLQSAGKALVDTTCPLVRRVHEAALALQEEGRHILVIGKAGHVEVRGVVEDLRSYDVIGNASEVHAYTSHRLGIVCQTTMPPDTVADVVDRVYELNPAADIRFVDTICRPTRLRQRAMLELLGRVDAVVVVGGWNSNNTRRLVELCRQYQRPVVHVERADQLCADWFSNLETVGLTAGTSTLDETIDEVHGALLKIAQNRIEAEHHHA